MENKFEGLYIIGYGLGGGFGGIRDYEVIQANNQGEANEEAQYSACQEYESYAGSNGLRDVDQIMEEDEIDDYDEALEVYEQEKESWLDYSAVPYSKEYEEKVMQHDYTNNYKEITG